jgi:mannose-6-phosphate isomerase-like protein (cupin superfamily)
VAVRAAAPNRRTTARRQRGEPPLKALLGIAVALVATAASAQTAPPFQFVLQAETMTQVAGQEMPQGFWSPKLKPAPYAAPNRLLWKLSDILAAHRGNTDWTQAIVRNSAQEADYVSLGPGRKTNPMMYGDDRVVFIVQDGALRVSIEGAQPFTATKGFLVSVPFRRVFILEAVGDKPALRFEVRQAGALPLYPLSETPPAATAAVVYEKATGRPGPAAFGYDTNPIVADFWKDVAGKEAIGTSKFVWDDHFASNIIRGKGVAVPPPSNKGHFHAYTEFWFVMEGAIGYQIEGFPYFEAQPGDIVNASTGRWHRAGISPTVPVGTRIAFNPRPTLLHNFEPPPQSK